MTDFPPELTPNERWLLEEADRLLFECAPPSEIAMHRQNIEATLDWIGDSRPISRKLLEDARMKLLLTTFVGRLLWG